MQNTHYIEQRDSIHREYQEALQELCILEKEELICEENNKLYQDYVNEMKKSNFTIRYQKASARFESAQKELSEFLKKDFCSD